jgi:ABC-type multidrug transport system permease subunit
MTDAISVINPGQTTLILILAIALPVIFILLGLALMKGAYKLKASPRAFLLASFIMGIVYVVMARSAYHDQKKWGIIIGYAVIAAVWPVVGLLQYRAMKRTKKALP